MIGNIKTVVKPEHCSFSAARRADILLSRRGILGRTAAKLFNVQV
jgi:hypothetical protein